MATCYYCLIRLIILLKESIVFQLRTKKLTTIVCAIVWLAALCMSMPQILYGRVEQVSDAKFCRVMFPDYERYNDSMNVVIVETTG